MKKQWHIIILGTTMALACALAGGTGWAQNAPDHSRYATLLKSHIQDGLVNYRTFKKDAGQLETYLGQLAVVDPEQLPRDEQMAFYINLYNAWTLKLILDNYPGVTSIKELGTVFKSPWKKEIVKLHGRKVSLDHIEHDILRPVYKDPRIHFAVNCASISCPPLLDEPYTGTSLNDQLDRVTLDFINDPQSTYLKDGTLYLSSIFKWFRQDFGENVAVFVKTFARGELAKQLEAQTKPAIRYLKYDWSLNGI